MLKTSQYIRGQVQPVLLAVQSLTIWNCSTDEIKRNHQPHGAFPYSALRNQEKLLHRLVNGLITYCTLTTSNSTNALFEFTESKCCKNLKMKQQDSKTIFRRFPMPVLSAVETAPMWLHCVHSTDLYRECNDIQTNLCILIKCSAISREQKTCRVCQEHFDSVPE